ALEAFDQVVDAAPRFQRRLRQPPGEKHVVFGLGPLRFGLEPVEFFFGLVARHVGYRGRRTHTSGSHSSRAYGTGRSSIRTSVASEAPTIWKRSRRRDASLDQNRARCGAPARAPLSTYAARA